MKPFLENSLNLTEDGIFKPYPVEEVIQLKLKDCTLNPDGTYSSNGGVDLSGLGLTILPVKFKEVKGSFWCGCNKLTSLEGAPRKVGEIFWCDHNKLTTLEGGPEHVGRSFYCDFNKLTSLKGAPETVNGGFSCIYNKLTTLKGAPEKVGLDFRYSCNPVSEEELRKTIKRNYL